MVLVICNVSRVSSDISIYLFACLWSSFSALQDNCSETRLTQFSSKRHLRHVHNTQKDRQRQGDSFRQDRQTEVTLTHQWLTLITTNIQAETSWPIWSNSIEFSVVWEYHTAYVFFSKLVSSKTPIRFSALPASICNQELELKTPHKHQTLIISHQQNIRPMHIGHQVDSILSEPIKTHSQPSKEYLCCN